MQIDHLAVASREYQGMRLFPNASCVPVSTYVFLSSREQGWACCLLLPTFIQSPAEDAPIEWPEFVASGDASTLQGA